MRKKNLIFIILLSICVLFLYQTAIASWLSFETREFAAGYFPKSVAIGDLDGNGSLDLAVANWDSNNVSVLLNNGDGTFQSAVNYTASDAWSVAIGDLDGNGSLDLAVSNYVTDNVSVLLNNGNGTFQSAVNYNGGDSCFSVALGDLDGNGSLDLAATNRMSDTVSVLINLVTCNYNGICNTPENCNTCPEDCIGKDKGNKTYCCGDWVCEGKEDSFNCAVDCGPPPVCGDDVCEDSEICTCPDDCGSPQLNETSCDDGIDNDCDGNIDCNDLEDCSLDPACECMAKGELCNSDEDCCSNDCRGKKCK